MSTIAVVDYGMGNRRSVQKALEHVGARALITSEPDALNAADGLVLPGVGAFPAGMSNLEARGLTGLLTDHAAANRPLLGICLGMQLLFERSHEHGGSRGLGLIEGEVTPLAADGLRVPHIGWNEVRFERPSLLTEGLRGTGVPFYHVHSFAARPLSAEAVVGTCEYGERFATIVSSGSVHGVQFHPEKSSADGLRLLENFVRVCTAEAAAGRAAAA